MCGKIRALDVLYLQNEMQKYHLEFDGIPEYINALEDAQYKAERANNPITNATLVIITKSTMLGAEQLPHANKDWDKLDVYQRTWTRWKTTYCAAANNLSIKNKPAGRKYQFGAAHTATPLLGDDTMCNTAGNNQPMGLAGLNGYFNNILAAATNEKAVLEDLVINLTTFTTSNEDMDAIIKKILRGE